MDMLLECPRRCIQSFPICDCNHIISNILNAMHSFLRATESVIQIKTHHLAAHGLGYTRIFHSGRSTSVKRLHFSLLLVFPACPDICKCHNNCFLFHS